MINPVVLVHHVHIHSFCVLFTFLISKQCEMAMMEEDAKVGKKKPNKLIVEEAVADDNSVISLNSATMDTLELFRYSIKKKPNKFHSSPGATQF